MIIANGHQYITLDDDFYVNGKKVIEAYANGNKVYPVETRTGTLIKIRGHKTIDETRTWIQDIKGVDNSHVDEFQSRIAGTASFVAVYEIADPVYSGHYFYTNGKRLLEVLGIADNDEFYMNAYSNMEQGDDSLWRVSVNTESKKREIHITNSFGLTATGGKCNCNRKMLYKQNFLPFRLPIEYRQSIGSYGYPDSGYSFTMIDDDPFTWMIREHNKLYSFSEDNVSVDYSMFWIKSCIERNSVMDLRIMGKTFYAEHCFVVTLRIPDDYNTAHTYKAVNVKKWSAPKPDMTGYLRGYYLRFHFPIEIMYIGNKFTAPDWARNVYESDLEW